jgi:preprotein translocase subunit SecY
MSAHFVLSMAQAWPDGRRALARLREDGRAGREALQGWLSALFFAAAVAQAAAEAGRLAPLAAAGAAGWAFRGRAGLTLVAGAVLCKHAVQRIDEWGLGEGVGVVIGGGIALGEQSRQAGFGAAGGRSNTNQPQTTTSNRLLFSSSSLVWRCCCCSGERAPGAAPQHFFGWLVKGLPKTARFLVPKQAPNA